MTRYEKVYNDGVCVCSVFQLKSYGKFSITRTMFYSSYCFVNSIHSMVNSIFNVANVSVDWTELNWMCMYVWQRLCPMHLGCLAIFYHHFSANVAADRTERQISLILSQFSSSISHFTFDVMTNSTRRQSKDTNGCTKNELTGGEIDHEHKSWAVIP